jgi:hypothetical protein
MAKGFIAAPFLPVGSPMLKRRNQRRPNFVTLLLGIGKLMGMEIEKDLSTTVIVVQL